MKEQSFMDFVKSQRDSSMGKKIHVGAITVANQINSLLGLKDVQENPKRGFVGIPAYDPKKGIAGVILFRLVKESGAEFTLEEQQPGMAIKGNTKEVILNLQLPVSDPCKEVSCKAVFGMQTAYEEAINNRWVIECADDPSELKFGFIVNNSEGRTGYFIPYKLLAQDSKKS